ncbi:MAG: hypothetical protein HC902_07125 [Calothrix sp. SM1_5_4]|nr:hypothetical protein [Calothrix sp. SM1_5_4]
MLQALAAVAFAGDCGVLLSLSSTIPPNFMRHGMKYNAVRTAIPGAKVIPDPSNIHSSHQWRIIDSISDYLIRYDSRSGTFEPILAEKWSLGDEGVRFTLRKDLKFNDGSPLTVHDVLATLKRIIRLRRSTHFPIWNEIEGCDGDQCSGLQVASNGDLIVRYKKSLERLFMFLSSPEASIWSEIDVRGEEFLPFDSPDSTLSVPVRIWELSLG